MELKTILLTLTIIALVGSMATGFYSDFMQNTDQTPKDISILKNKYAPQILEITQNATDVVGNIQHPADINIFSVIGTFLSAGVAIVRTVIFVPVILMSMVSDISNLMPIRIPPEFVTILYIFITIGIMFAISKFMAGRN